MTLDRARFARPSQLPGIELVTVSYRERVFPMHMHAEYVVGVVTAGAEALETSGERHIVTVGDVLQLNPGQPHANRALGCETLRYQVFYLSPEAIRPCLDDGRLPAFDRPVVKGSPHAADLVACHAVLSGNDSSAMEQESALMRVVRTLDVSGATTSVATGPAIERVRDYIDAHFSDDFSLSSLADVAGLSLFHMSRSFKAAVGLSPLAYRNLLRVHEARRRLIAGEAIATIACDLGFADQSHLTRQFQKLIGISPAQYRV